MSKAVGALMIAAGPTMVLLAALDILTFWEAVSVGALYIVLGVIVTAAES